MPQSNPMTALCAVDFSEQSAGALRCAAAMVKPCNGRVILVHAHSREAPVYFTSGMIADLEKESRHAIAQLGVAVRQWGIREAGDIEIDVKVVEGDPASAILHAAEDAGAELIALGTHGRRGLKRLMLGSVAETVLHWARVPVLTVRTPGVEGRPRKIFCPVAEDDLTRPALERASALAACCESEVVAWTVPAGQNNPSNIMAAAKEIGADLIVIASEHQRFGERTLLGTHAAEFVRQASCPVLTVFTEEKIRHDSPNQMREAAG